MPVNRVTSPPRAVLSAVEPAIIVTAAPLPEPLIPAASEMDPALEPALSPVVITAAPL